MKTQKADLMKNLERERQQASSTVKNLEDKLRDADETLAVKVQELGQAHNHHLPLDLELDAFATLLAAEERRYMNVTLRYIALHRIALHCTALHH